MTNWTEALHPRDPVGSSTGGQWTKAANSARKAAGLLPEGWSAKSGDLEQARKFVRARDKLSGDKKGFLSDYTAEEIAQHGGRVFVDSAGNNGFIVSPEGDLQNVFSLNGRGMDSVFLAIDNGAKTLDCFDGFLPKWYKFFGFEEYKREANWTAGGPDVVFMKLGKVRR